LGRTGEKYNAFCEFSRSVGHADNRKNSNRARIAVQGWRLNGFSTLAARGRSTDVNTGGSSGSSALRSNWFYPKITAPPAAGGLHQRRILGRAYQPCRPATRLRHHMIGSLDIVRVKIGTRATPRGSRTGDFAFSVEFGGLCRAQCGLGSLISRRLVSGGRAVQRSIARDNPSSAAAR